MPVSSGEETQSFVSEQFVCPTPSVFKQLSLLIKNSLIGSAASYFLTLTLAKYLGPSDFGVYSHVMIVGSITSVLVSFATESTAPILFAQSKSESTVLNAVYSVRLLFFGLILLGLANIYFDEPVSGLGILAITIASLNFSFLYEMTNKYVTYSYIYLCERLLYVGTIFALIFLKTANLTWIFAALFLYTIGSCGWQAYANRSLVKQFAYIKFHTLNEILKGNSFLVLISFSTFAYGGFSRLILEQKFGVEELGIYSAGWQITMAITIFQAQIYRLWRVKLTTALVERDLTSLKAQVKDYFWYSTLPVTIFALVVCIFTPELVSLLFGSKYGLLLDLLPIFCAYFPIISLDGLATIFWVGVGNRTEYLSISILISLTLIAILSLLPQRLGLPSFAAAVICTHALSVSILLVRFYRKYVLPRKSFAE